MLKPVLNLDDISLEPWPYEFDPKSELANQFQARMGAVSGRVGARKLGYNITAIPPGKAAFPLHSHRINEEMFFVLQGSGEVRVGSDTFPIRKGDFIACPPSGGGAAHQIRNTGTEELRFLAVSTQIFPEINVYPDSGKFRVLAYFQSGADDGWEVFSFQGRQGESLDYWDGEGKQ